MKNYKIQLENNWKLTTYENLKLELGLDEDSDYDFFYDEYIKINIFDFHRNYSFPRELNKNFWYIGEDFSKWTKEDKKQFNDYDYYKQEKKELAEIKKDYHVFFLEFYEHSIIRFDIIENNNKPICQYRNWDGTSNVGFIAVSKELTKNRKKALEQAINYLEDYNNYINGRVYKYSLYEQEKFYSKDLKKSITNYDYYDGCTWFYQEDYCQKDAISSIKYYLNSKGVEFDKIELVEE